MIRFLCFTVLVALTATSTQADQYWIAYEGNDYPENEGWTRNWGDWQGQFHGGANRSLQDGILTIDSLHDTGVFDFVFLERPGETDPDAGEVFIMQWRLRVQQVIGRVDPDVALRSDAGWAVGLAFDEDSVESLFEDGVSAPFTPGVFHSYVLRSSDMRTYELYIDGGLAIEGVFFGPLSQSRVGWGDGVQGAASLADWDYFRFGVVLADPCSDVLCGDCNCDGAFDGADIDTFFLTLVDPMAWKEAFPKCDRTCIADINGDESVDGADIDAFFQALAVGQCP